MLPAPPANPSFAVPAPPAKVNAPLLFAEPPPEPPSLPLYAVPDFKKSPPAPPPTVLTEATPVIVEATPF